MERALSRTRQYLSFPWRLLVADDDLASAFSRILTDAGAGSLSVHTDGHSALVATRAGSFDLLLLNYRMRPMNGAIALRRMREEGVSAPAIFISAWSRDSVPERIDDLGIDAWITKPFLNGHLIDTIEATILSSRR
ncbi:MAG: response regulator [Hyphomicrobiaceae bacterium]